MTGKQATQGENMKGDFSKWEFNPLDNYSSVLQQQGRALLDQDWNASSRINQHHRQMLGQDAIGEHVAAIPVDDRDSFRVSAASTDGASVTLTLNNGRAWIDGRLLQVADGFDSPIDVEYLGPLVQTPQAQASTIADGVRDAVILETWDEAVNGFQLPKQLLEPALGGVDTTERMRHCHAIKLLRLVEGDDCGNLQDKLDDNFDLKGRLTVSAEEITISGECPVEAGGGYTGFEHYLMRIEVMEADADGNARIKWSRFNGGLVGRGSYNSLTEQLTITANDQMINHCGLTDFYLEALQQNDQGCWDIVFRADATLGEDGVLGLSDIVSGSVWPGDSAGRAFFRLWDGKGLIGDYPVGPNPDELVEGLGIRLQLDAPLADNSNYKPGDYWNFPLRAAGAIDFDAATAWPNNAPPEGVHFRRVPLAILRWDAIPSTSIVAPDNIHDCRRIFKPLAKDDNCCSFTVGDGARTFGDFDSIQQAIENLPERGGHICVLAGDYYENLSITRDNVHISGCGDLSHIQPQNPLPGIDIDGALNVSIDKLQITSHLEGSGIRINNELDLAQQISITNLLINSAMKSAIVSSDALGLEIRKNRIHMADVATPEQALFIVADDVLIEHNRIEVTPDDDIVPGQFIYAGRGGIQIGGGCEDVRIIDNRIKGGSGNGITLGALQEITVQGEGGGQIGWVIFEDNPCDPYSSGTIYFPEPEDGTRYVSAGDLYGIRIERNQVEYMGLNGISVVTFFDLESADEFISIDELDIIGNQIQYCLTRDLQATPDNMRNSMGYGAISLADVDNLKIYDNKLENNGPNHLLPICGIYLLTGEGVDISRNLIINNGAKTDESAENALLGARGGVFIQYVTSPKIAVTSLREMSPRQNGVTALNMQGNIIAQPLGRALSATALGPVSIQDNQLTSQGFVPQLSAPSNWATTVFIFNLGVSNELYLQQLFFNGQTLMDKQVNFWPGVDGDIIVAPQDGIDEQRIFAYLGNGNVLFNDNQVMLDLTDRTGFEFGLTSIAIATLDDVSFQDNQCDMSFDIVDEFLLTQLFLFGLTARVSNNRLKESVLGCLFSGVTLSLFANTTAVNQCTHCIKAFNLLGADNLIASPNSILFDWFNLCGDDDGDEIIGAAGNRQVLGQANSQPQTVLNLLR